MERDKEYPCQESSTHINILSRCDWTADCHRAEPEREREPRPEQNQIQDQNRNQSKPQSQDGRAVRKRHELVYQCKSQSTGNGRDSVQLLTVSIWNVTLKTKVTNPLHLSTVQPSAINRFGLYAVPDGWCIKR